jgi:hypothetical protein
MWIVLIGLNIVLPLFNLDFLSQLIKYAENILEFRFGVLQILTIILTTIVLYILNYFVVTRTNVKKKIA